MKYRLKHAEKNWEVKGMIIEGNTDDTRLVEIDSADICNLNKEIMTKDQIIECMKAPRYGWGLNYLEPITVYKITRLELGILKHINEKGIEYIARDSDSSLCAYKSRPYKINCMWIATRACYTMFLFKDCFQFINWEDEEPTLIKDILENYVVVEDEII